MSAPTDPATIPTATITAVGGGPVLAAEYADLEHLAGACAHAGLGLAEWTALPAGTLVDPDLVATSVLAPVTFADVEVMLGAALLQLPTGATEWAALGGSVIAARGVLEEVDNGRVQRLWTDTTEILEAEAAASNPAWTAALGAGLDGLDGGRDSWWQTEQRGLGGTIGLTTALLGAGGVGSLSAKAAHQLYPHNRGPHTVSVGPRSGTTPPASLAAMTEHLHELADGPDGDIEVQTMVGSDGAVRHVVYLPGTDDMNPLSSDDQVRDMQTNLQLMAGHPDAYGKGVLAALGAAGVRAGEPVLLIGHSQGGMEAVALAAHASPYDVTQVVTLGSPTAQVGALPSHVHALSLAHDGDVVPELGGFDKPAVNHVVVHFGDDHLDGVIANHSYDHYEAGALAVQASTDPTIRTSLAGLDPFLATGQHATSQVFQIVRTQGG